MTTQAEYGRIIDQAISESAWVTHITGSAVAHGFQRTYHTHDSRRSESGFPDLVLSNGLGRLLFIEAKRESGVLMHDQIGWLDDLAMMRDAGNTGIEVYVARPSDRDALWSVLYHGPHTIGAGGLHQWCMLPVCQRCMADRDNATLIIRGRGGRIVKTIRRAKARGYIG